MLSEESLNHFILLIEFDILAAFTVIPAVFLWLSREHNYLEVIGQ